MTLKTLPKNAASFFERRGTMSEKSNRQPSFGTDIKRLPIKELVKRIGPGLIATGIVIGPGAVTTSAMLGANYGYSG
jgi:hypothetical protein